jgi:DNA-directed RNA polymerase specialized sigma24 family protein
VENGVSEEVLVGQVAGGDREAFHLLFERFQPILFRAALYRTRDADRAHDLVQETFIRIWQRVPHSRPATDSSRMPSAFATTFFGIRGQASEGT